MSPVESETKTENEKKTFADLGVCEALQESLQAMKFKEPTDIQKQAIPYALEGRDIIGIAKTGSGKTAAFALPVLQDLLEKQSRMFAIVLAPVRELAVQIAEHFEALGASIGVRCAVVVGGVDMGAQAIALSKRPHIIVGTPGRIVDHLENTKGFNLRSVKYLIMDEADRLLGMDFEVEIDKILKSLPRERSSYLFSATMTSKVEKLQRAALKNPVKVEVDSKYTTVDKCKQQYVFIPEKHKDCYLVYALNELSGHSTMVFVGTCAAAQRLALLLRSLGFPAIPIHGQMTQPKRLGALNKFKAGERSILICTDVASRGLDIPSVDVVMNFDVPTHSKDYIHRIGRTARAGRSGLSVTFVTQYTVPLFQKIEKLIGKRLDAYPAPEEAVLLLYERVAEAQRLAAVQMRETDMGKKRQRGSASFDEEEEGDVSASAPKAAADKKGKGKKGKKPRK